MTGARVVCADPPWRFGDALPGPGRGATKHYATMPARDIAALQLPPIAADALLFLWRVSAMQQEAIDVARAWGFRPVSEIVWCKTNANGRPRIGMGRYVRCSHESALIAVRGHGVRLITDHGVPSWFMAPRGEHSAKPVEFYQLIERLVGEGPYLELFGRAPRDGWTVVGDALGTRLSLPLEADRCKP